MGLYKGALSKMTAVQQLYHHYKRYRTLQTDTIKVLPIVILMPHSACNCRCVMCDIWKDNQNLKQLREDDIIGLLKSLEQLETKTVLMSGGEALMNPRFFRFCEILKTLDIKVTLLSTGLLLEKFAKQIVRHVHDVIVSLDGSEVLHDKVRNIPGAFNKLKRSVRAVKSLEPGFRVTGRTVIQRLNFREWPAIIDAAKSIGLDQVSFLPADVSSHAFNREVLWSDQRKDEVLPAFQDLPLLYNVIETIIRDYRDELNCGFIAESPLKLRNIYTYYAAVYGQNPFPYKKCNAPWVSTVVEADGKVRPCFFHEPVGNIREDSLINILNNKESREFRKQLDMATNPVCVKCVCSLYLSPRAKLNRSL